LDYNASVIQRRDVISHLLTPLPPYSVKNSHQHRRLRSAAEKTK